MPEQPINHPNGAVLDADEAWVLGDDLREYDLTPAPFGAGAGLIIVAVGDELLHADISRGIQRDEIDSEITYYRDALELGGLTAADERAIHTEIARLEDTKPVELLPYGGLFEIIGGMAVGGAAAVIFYNRIKYWYDRRFGND